MPKLRLKTWIVSGVTAFGLTSAFADHPDGGTWASQRLAAEAGQLDYLVISNHFATSVRQSSQGFALAAASLAYCYDQADQTDGSYPGHHPDFTFYCGSEQEELQWAWQDVESWLQDTHFDFPHVHQQFLRTQDAYGDLWWQ